MDNFKLRNAEKEDKEEIGKVYCSSWKSAYKNIVPNEYLNSLTSKDCEKEIEPTENLLLEYKGKIVGIINFGLSREYDNKHLGEIRAIYILEEFWNKGLGEILFNSASLTMMQTGISKIYLWVASKNKRAISFYEKMKMYNANETKVINIANKDISLVKYELTLM